MAITLQEQSVIRPTTNKLALTTIVLDSQLNYIETVPWKDAMTDYLQGSVNVLASYTEETPDGAYREVTVSSGVNMETGLRTVLPLPFMVSWKSFVYYPYAAFVRSNSPIATKRAVLTRDKFRCAYCGGKADTVDHILPQSRGGENTWTNLIASCKVCNNRKADRTPEEVGMKLLWEPKPHDGGILSRQQDIWDFIYHGTTG